MMALASIWLERLLSATLVFNLLDTVLTLLVVRLGLASEANPVMAGALDASPVVFALAKIGVVSLGVLVLWKFRQRRIAVAGGVGVFCVYAMVMLYHIQSVEQLIRGMS